MIINEYFKKVLSHKGFNIFDVNHSEKRFEDRVSSDMSLYQNHLKKAIDWLIKNNKENTEDRYVFLDKNKTFGIQIEWRIDFKSKEFAGFSATSFGKDQMKYFTKDDKEILLEQLKEDCYSKDMERYFKTEGSYWLRSDDLSECNFGIFMEKGKVYRDFVEVRLD